MTPRTHSITRRVAFNRFGMDCRIKSGNDDL
jgi:hypothetical protein